MDSLTFISSVIGDIAWPAVVVLVLWVICKNAAQITSIVEKVRYKDLELFLRKQEFEVARSAADEVVASADVELPAEVQEKPAVINNNGKEVFKEESGHGKVMCSLGSSKAKSGKQDEYKIYLKNNFYGWWLKGGSTEEGGDFESVVLACWLKLEATLYSLVKNGEKIPRTGGIVIKRLCDDGRIDPADFALYQSLQKIRNGIVHGTSAAKVTREECLEYEKFVNILLAKLSVLSTSE